MSPVSNALLNSMNVMTVPPAAPAPDAEGHVTSDGRKIGSVLMDLRHITLRFGGVTAIKDISFDIREGEIRACLLYTSPSPRDATLSRMPSSA